MKVQVIDRRAFLAGSAALLASCRRQKAFTGYVFVANQDGRAIAAVDLGVFAVARYIRVDGAPTAVIAHAARRIVYVLTPDNGSLHEIGIDHLSLGRALPVCRTAVSMRLAPDGNHIYILCSDPRRLVSVSLDSFRPAWQMDLPAEPFDLDIDPTGALAAISYGKAGSVQLLDLTARRAGYFGAVAAEVGALRFLGNTKELQNLLVADTGGRMLLALQVPSGRLITKLPLAVRPDNFCFSEDGGQLFVTGEGLDAVVIVYPYYTPEVGETVLAGRSPGAMASAGDLLFVADTTSGEVSILNIDSHKVIGVAAVGSDPGYITVTPDNQYALVLNEGSGDMAVLWIPAVRPTNPLRRRARNAPLFNMIPVGSKPVAAAILPV